MYRKMEEGSRIVPRQGGGLFSPVAREGLSNEAPFGSKLMKVTSPAVTWGVGGAGGRAQPVAGGVAVCAMDRKTDSDSGAQATWGRGPQMRNSRKAGTR